MKERVKKEGQPLITLIFNGFSVTSVSSVVNIKNFCATPEVYPPLAEG